MSFNWTCPFCGRHTTITEECCSTDYHRIGLNSRLSNVAICTTVISCPNEQCKELAIDASLLHFKYDDYIQEFCYEGEIQRWSLRPQASVKVFPDYIPRPILQDYREACLIRDLSPKASATLSRRCLQGMIRDSWGVTKSRLVDEIDTLRDKVDVVSWNAIDAVRNLGNIGAHMERDINVVVDVDPNEAALLIDLIETLLTEWYVNPYERNIRMSKLIDSAAAKKPKRISE